MGASNPNERLWSSVEGCIALPLYHFSFNFELSLGLIIHKICFDRSLALA